MARVWFAHDGPEGVTGDAVFAELSVGDCSKLLGLSRSAVLPPARGGAPRFDPDAKRKGYAGPSYVVVEIGADEATRTSWPAGFYCLAKLTPAAARKRIEQRAEERPRGLLGPRQHTDKRSRSRPRY